MNLSVYRYFDISIDRYLLIVIIYVFIVYELFIIHLILFIDYLFISYQLCIVYDLFVMY